MIVPREGEQDGKRYTTVQHYATLVISSLHEGEVAEGTDMDAYQRLEHATACQARFPETLAGLGGVLKVHADGGSQRAEFDFQNGQLELSMDEASDELREWTSAKVASLLRHRMPADFPQGDGQHALTLAARDGHPLGRRIDLNDGAGSYYRVSEDRITYVERSFGGRRMALSVAEDTQTDSGHFLPKHFSTFWFGPEGDLQKSETFADEFEEKDGVFLPQSRTVTTAVGGAVNVRRIEFLNLELLSGQ